MVVIKIALDSLWACKAPSIIDVNYRDQGIQKRHLKVRRRLLWMICKHEVLHPGAVKHWSRLGIWCYASWITQLLYKGFPTSICGTWKQRALQNSCHWNQKIAKCVLVLDLLIIIHASAKKKPFETVC